MWSLKKLAGFLLSGFIVYLTQWSVLAQGTAFTYQGRLNAGGATVSGNYDFTFTLYDNSATNTGQVGAPQTLLNVGVTNGLFTVMLDFGSSFTGASRWLALSVRTNGAPSFTALSPLQKLTPAPYAIYAPMAGSASVASSIASGTSLTNVIIDEGVLRGNGAGLTNIPTGALTGVSSGHFTSSGSIYAFGVFGPPALADFNGDGLVDIAYPTQSQYMEFLTNNGTQELQALIFSLPGILVHAVPVDLNNDGMMDVAVLDQYYSHLYLLTNTGGGTFAGPTSLPVSVNPYLILPLDLNGDGRVDFVIPSYAGFTVLANNGNGFNRTDYTNNGGFISVAATDLNGDGRPDLVLGTYGASYLYVFTNNGTGGFALCSTNFTPGNPYYLLATNLAPNTAATIFAANNNGSALTVYSNNNGFLVSNGSMTVSGGPTCIAAGDLNGDGSLDLVIASAGSSLLTVFTNDGSGHLIFSQSPPNPATGSFVEIADINGDGRPDLVMQDGSVGLNVDYNNSSYAGAFIGDGSGLTGLNASMLTGVLLTNVLPGFQASTAYSVIGGGQQNTIIMSADHAVIGGGWFNSISTNDYEGTIAGGYNNRMLASASYATIGGGEFNTNGGSTATIAGGFQNLAS